MEIGGSSDFFDSPFYSDDHNGSVVHELRANGVCIRASDVEAKLDDGNILEAESVLREGLSLNFEEARALLGRLEYLRGNLEGALRVFDGIDLQAVIQRLQPSLSDKSFTKKGRSRSDSGVAVSQHAASLVLEAIYLKAKTFQKLGKILEGAQECKSVLDAVEKMFFQGAPDVQFDSRLQETVNQAVELLPELWKQAGNNSEALSAYRRALLFQWNLDDDCCLRIHKAFTAFLLYSGVEFTPPCLGVQNENSYVPRNTLEEAILLLMILLRKSSHGKGNWDPSVMDHLTFALSVNGQTSVLARLFEELIPGVYNRVDRWKSLALCYRGEGKNEAALNILKMLLHKHENPDDIRMLLLAAKICSEDSLLAMEGVEYAQRALICHGMDDHFRGAALHLLGLCYGKKAKVSSSDYERFRLQSEALKSLNEAISLDNRQEDIIFDLGLQYAEQRNLTAALWCAEQFINATGGSVLKGWKLLALVLTAQQCFSEAEVVIDAALDETASWEQGPLLRMKTKMKLSRALPTDAIETCRLLLALVQGQKRLCGPSVNGHQDEKHVLDEFEIWLALANIYSSLSHWGDAEICLEKARELKNHSAEVLQVEGAMLEGQGRREEAMAAYVNGMLEDPDNLICRVKLGALLPKMGLKGSPLARSLFSDALRIEPTSHSGWYHLGLLHNQQGRTADAADCFQAACMLQESDPVQPFTTSIL